MYRVVFSYQLPFCSESKRLLPRRLAGRYYIVLTAIANNHTRKHKNS